MTQNKTQNIRQKTPRIITAHPRLVLGSLLVATAALLVGGFALRNSHNVPSNTVPRGEIFSNHGPAQGQDAQQKQASPSAKPGSKPPNGVAAPAAPPAEPSASANPQKSPTAAPKSNAIAQAPPAPGPLLDEQFNGSTLNGQQWEVQSYPVAYRNNEEQDYVPGQVRVADGNLQITAAKDASGQWHSGEVHSKWQYKYGDFEVRMRLSQSGTGIWPAAWMMGRQDSWPDNGEIDIVENINGAADVYGTIHGGNGSGPNGHWQLQHAYSPIDITQYHNYKISKHPDNISWWVDGVKRGEWLRSQTPAGKTWPFESHDYYGLLNLAVGGTWPGSTNGSTPASVTMYVDWFTVTAN
jgi:beta-glucanase (GH16 family)